METRKFVLLSVGVLAGVTLLAAPSVFAQLSCTSRTTTEGTGNFIVHVNQQNLNGHSTYQYTMQSPTGKNPNKFFVYVKDGLEGDLVSTSCNSSGTSCSPGEYVGHYEFSGGFPPAEVWAVNNHEDGVVATNVALDKVITLRVPERFKPEEGVTTVLLGIGNKYEHCGPILGPTGLAGGQEGPLVLTTAHLTFENGCSYFAGVDPTTNYVVSLTADPNTPIETVCGPSGCRACEVDTNADCAGDLGLVFCPQLRIGENPIQSEAGGTCYYPYNIKFTC